MAPFASNWQAIKWSHRSRLSWSYYAELLGHCRWTPWERNLSRSRWSGRRTKWSCSRRTFESYDTIWRLLYWSEAQVVRFYSLPRCFWKSSSHQCPQSGEVQSRSSSASSPPCWWSDGSYSQGRLTCSRWLHLGTGKRWTLVWSSMWVLHRWNWCPLSSVPLAAKSRFLPLAILQSSRSPHFELRPLS